MLLRMRRASSVVALPRGFAVFVFPGRQALEQQREELEVLRRLHIYRPLQEVRCVHKD
jgi:hypothetical protein